MGVMIELLLICIILLLTCEIKIKLETLCKTWKRKHQTDKYLKKTTSKHGQWFVKSTERLFAICITTLQQKHQVWYQNISVYERCKYTVPNSIGIMIQPHTKILTTKYHSNN